MRILVTGAGGMLAQALVPELRGRGHSVVALDRAALDVTDPAAVHERVLALRPEVVVQCAAYTEVDVAEAEPARAFAVNAEGAAHVARACHQIGALFVYPSTDYVFPGTQRVPYAPLDRPDPVNAYGRSKLAGEEAAREAGRALVVRTSWLYGVGRRNFVQTMLQRAAEGGEIRVVDDQVGRPTWSGTLVGVLAELAERGVSGTYHASDGGEPVSWYGFARAILEREHPDAPLLPVPTSEYPRPAARPAYSVLDCGATEAVLGRPLPHWRESLAAYLASQRRAGV